MKKRLLLKFIVLFTILALNPNNFAYSANIVYPKSNNVTINSPRTFFIGSEDPTNTLKINDENVEIHPSGGFWHTVELQDGVNTFKIDNGLETKIYTITKPSKTNTVYQAPKEICFEKPIAFQTKTDNIPLRSTPVDFGINRLQHLQKGIPLKVIGEYGNFYKVQLARDDFAWINKDSVSKLNDNKFNLAKIESYTYKEEKNKRIFSIKLNQKVPYILSDNNGLDLVIYGVEEFPYNKYEFHINDIGKRTGFNSYYKDDNELVIEVKNLANENFDKAKPLKNLKVAIDAGHGGSELGAIGCLGNNEKDINLDIALKLQKKLENAGATVFMTRDKDVEISLNDRVSKTNNFGADYFISIHNNALPDIAADKKSSGTEVYYFYPQSRDFAKSIISAITSEVGTKNNGVKQQSFAVVRNTQCISVLVEVAYIINPEDNAKLMDEKFQDGVAEAIVNGLEKYLNVQ